MHFLFENRSLVDFQIGNGRKGRRLGGCKCISYFFRFCPYQRFRIFLFLFSLLLVFSYVLISSLLLTRWKLVLIHFDSSASSFHRKSSVCAAVVSRELLSKKKNHLLVVSELVRVIVLRRKPRVIPSSCHTGRPYATAHIVFI